MFGYNFTIKKLNINLRAGIGFGFSLDTKARSIDYELSQIIKTVPKRFQFNYLLSPTFNYQLTQNFALQINPQVLLNGNSLINYNDLNQRYTNWSMHVGLQYIFKKKTKFKN